MTTKTLTELMIEYTIENNNVIEEAHKIRLQNMQNVQLQQKIENEAIFTNPDVYKAWCAKREKNKKFNYPFKQHTKNVGIDFPDYIYVYDSQDLKHQLNIFPAGSVQFYDNQWYLLNPLPDKEIIKFNNNTFFVKEEKLCFENLSHEDVKANMLFLTENYPYFSKSDFDYYKAKIINCNQNGLVKEHVEYVCAADKNGNYGLGVNDTVATLFLLNSIYEKTK